MSTLNRSTQLLPQRNQMVPEVMPGYKESQQKHKAKPLVQQGNWRHSTRPVRLHTLHPAGSQIWVLACHTWQRKQPSDNIHHMDQFQMALTTLWTQSGRRCLPREPWQSTSRSAPAELLKGMRYRPLLPKEAWSKMSYRQIVGNRWLITKKELLDIITSKQETYNLYLCGRRYMFRSTLSRAIGLQQPSPRHLEQHSQDHTLWRPGMDPTTKWIRDSSDQLGKHHHLVKWHTVPFPAA